MNYNKAILAGNLTRDWETKSLSTGTKVANSAIAVNRKRKDGEETLFMEVTAFAKTADILTQYTGKGSTVLLEGHLKLEQWESREGQRRQKISLTVDSFQFVGRREDNGQTEDRPRSTNQPRNQNLTSTSYDEEEDAPF